jgi:hypothetical protein
MIQPQGQSEDVSVTIGPRTKVLVGPSNMKYIRWTGALFRLKASLFAQAIPLVMPLEVSFNKRGLRLCWRGSLAGGKSSPGTVCTHMWLSIGESVKLAVS